MAKIPKGRLSDLFETMNNNSDLSSTAINPDAPVVTAPTQSSLGSDIPMLREWETAFMIMNGLKARWAFNYWQVSNREGAESGIPKNAELHHWESVAEDLQSRTAKR